MRNPEKQYIVRTFLVCLLGASVALAAAPQAPGPEPNKGAAPAALQDYLHQVESSYRAVRTLSTEFTQTYLSGGRTRVESGKVYFAKGGLMRWDYQRPKDKLFLSDGKRLLLYVPDEKQLTRTPLKASEDMRVPFRLLLSRFDLRRLFSRIEFADGAWPHDPSDRILRAFPKRGWEEDYREARIELDPQFDIRRLEIVYPDESVMDFRFDKLVRNAPLTPSLFKFTPPPGTEIIDQR